MQKKQNFNFAQKIFLRKNKQNKKRTKYKRQNSWFLTKSTMNNLKKDMSPFLLPE